MYAAPVDYVAARSWAEAVGLLREGGEEAKVIAGGQSLVPMMTLRLASPSLLVDVTSADRPRIDRQDGHLVITAVTRHADLERSPTVAAECPLLARAASLIGNVRVRHRGTIGGSLAHADPSAELPCVSVALGMEVRTLGPEGERRIPAAEFFESYFTTVLDAAEVVTAVEVPVVPPGSAWAFVELSGRTGDFAIVAVAALLELDEAGRCASARLAAAGMGERPIELAEAAAALVGELPDERAAKEAGRRAAANVQASSTAHASGDYRRAMLEVLVQRATLEAVERVRGNPS